MIAGALIISWPSTRRRENPIEPSVRQATEASTPPGAATDEHGIRRHPVAVDGLVTVRVVDATSGDPIEDVRLIAVIPDKDVAVIGRSRSDGEVHIGDSQRSGAYVLFHDDYEVFRFNLDGSGGDIELRIRPRPKIRCVLEDVSSSVAAALEFHVVVGQRDDALLNSIGQCLGFQLLGPHPWSGLAGMDVQALQYGPCSVRARASFPGAVSHFAEASVSLDVTHASHRAVLRFDPAISVSPATVVIDAMFAFPHNVEVLHAIYGPFAGHAGPVIATIGTQRSFEANSNEPATHEVANIYPGIYEWVVTAVGYGSFPIKRFRVNPGDGRIALRNEAGIYRTGTLMVHMDEEAPSVDVRVFDGSYTITGHVFYKTEFDNPDRTAKWEYTVPADLDLWAVGYASEELCSRPVRLGATEGVNVSRMDAWVPQRTVAFELVDAAADGGVSWLEIRDENTGYFIVTKGRQGSRVGRMGLPEGRYSVQLRWDGGEGEVQYFAVDDRTPTIRVVR